MLIFPARVFVQTAYFDSDLDVQTMRSVANSAVLVCYS
jgi:hypothetical protein